MSNKQCVINKIVCKKSKKGHQLLLELGINFFLGIGCLEKSFRAKCLKSSDSAYRHLFCCKICPGWTDGRLDGWMVALFLDLPHGWLPVDHNFIIIITITCCIIKFYSINSKFHIVSAN